LIPVRERHSNKSREVSYDPKRLRGRDGFRGGSDGRFHGMANRIDVVRLLSGFSSTTEVNQPAI
jgi:hypothetical protein